MRLIFVHYVYEDRGSAQDLHNYAEIAKALGHEVVVYGPPNEKSSFNYSRDIGSADAVITTGIEESFFSARVDEVPRVTMMSGFERTRSAASSGKRSERPSEDR